MLANGCVLCNCKDESIDHIRIHCVTVKALGQLLFSLFGIAWVLVPMVRNTLLG